MRNGRWPRLTRDGLLFASGLGLLTFGAVARSDSALVAGTTIVLSPVVLRSDERRKNGDRS